MRYSGHVSTKILEQTLADLQQRVERLEATSLRAAKVGWRELVGFAKEDELFRKAMKLGADWRKQANREGR